MTTSNVALATDTLVLARHEGRWYVLLVQRRWDPFQGCWAIPGGEVNDGEDFAAAAVRELAEETGITVPGDLLPVGVYGAPGRDPRGRVVSWAYLTVLDHLLNPVAADDAADARWLPLSEVVAGALPLTLAFDHNTILADALNRRLGIRVAGGHLVRMTNRLEPGDVVSKDRPDGEPSWWRIVKRAGTDEYGAVQFFAECVDSPHADRIGRSGLFGMFGDREVYLKP